MYLKKKPFPQKILSLERFKYQSTLTLCSQEHSINYVALKAKYMYFKEPLANLHPYTFDPPRVLVNSVPIHEHHLFCSLSFERASISTRQDLKIQSLYAFLPRNGLISKPVLKSCLSRSPPSVDLPFV